MRLGIRHVIFRICSFPKNLTMSVDAGARPMQACSAELSAAGCTKQTSKPRDARNGLQMTERGQSAESRWQWLCRQGSQQAVGLDEGLRPAAGQ